MNDEHLLLSNGKKKKITTEELGAENCYRWRKAITDPETGDAPKITNS